MILTRGTARAMRGCGAFKIFVNGFLRGGWVELARSFKRLRENNMRKQMFFFVSSNARPPRGSYLYYKNRSHSRAAVPARGGDAARTQHRPPSSTSVRPSVAEFVRSEEAAGHVEVARERLNLLPERRDVRAIGRLDVLLKVSELRPARLRLAVDRDLHALVDQVRDFDEIIFQHPARRHRRRPDADAARDERGRVPGDGVLVQRDVRLVENVLHARAVDAHRSKVAQDEVVIRAARDERVAELRQPVRERRAVGDDLLLVPDELRGHRLLERDRERADRVVVRAALKPGENRAVDLLFELLLVEDHPAAGAAEGFVRRRRDDVRVRERIVHELRGD
eukprot:31365-Pelagococcus_subviridis.AAC.2